MLKYRFFFFFNFLVIILLNSTNIFAVSLEEKFTAEVFRYQEDDESNYVQPNELESFNAKDHLDKITEPGPLISVGTVRGLFDLILCDRCTGLITVDLSTQVKNYMDFEFLLLRISESPAQYRHLAQVGVDSKMINLPKLEAELRGLIWKNRKFARSAAGQYYLTYFRKFMYTYYVKQHKMDWKKSRPPFGVDYFSGDSGAFLKNFKKLHQIATEGNMIAVTRDVNDLGNYATDAVGIDISNVPDFVYSVDFKAYPTKNPIIIWTEKVVHGGWNYYSYKFFPINDSARSALDEIQKPQHEQKMTADSLWGRRLIFEERYQGFLTNYQFSRAPINSYSWQSYFAFAMYGVEHFFDGQPTLVKKNEILRDATRLLSVDLKLKAPLLSYLEDRKSRTKEYGGLSAAERGIPLSNKYNVILKLIKYYPILKLDSTFEQFISSVREALPRVPDHPEALGPDDMLPPAYSGKLFTEANIVALNEGSLNTKLKDAFNSH